MTIAHNRLWEYQTRNREYWWTQLQKLLAWLIDMLIVLIPQILFFFFLPISTIVLGLASFVWATSYMSMCLLFFQKSCGLMITRLAIVHKLGFFTKNYHYLLRAIIFGIYSMPIIGWSLITVTLLCELILKGISPCEYLSQTNTVTKGFADKLQQFVNQNERGKEICI